MFNPVLATDLAAAAAFFPPVAEPCGVCHGDSTSKGCDRCGGSGILLRDMESREEHAYLLKLILEGSNGRPESNEA